MSDPMACRSCGGVMQAGYFYVSSSEHPVLFNYVSWVLSDGQSLMDILHKRAAPQFPVMIYRCEKCGLLDLYANDPHEWQS